MPTNYFMLPDHGGHVGTLTFHGTFAGRPEPVMKWFQTTYWNYFRQNAELAGKFQRKSKDKYGRKVESDDAPQESSKYIIIGTLVPIVVSNDPVDDREWVPFAQITDDAFKALKNNALLVRLRPLTSRQADKLIHLSDFLTTYHEKNPTKDLSRISVPQASQMCVEWDAELLRAKEEEALKAGTHLLYTHDDGATLWLLSAVEAVKREGERLGNCLASNSSHYLSVSGALMVVRNAEKSSLAAAQLKMRMGFDGKVVQCMDAMQFYGRGNSRVPSEAVKVMDAAAKALDWRSWDDPTLPFTSFNDVKYDEDVGVGDDEDTDVGLPRPVPAEDEDASAPKRVVKKYAKKSRAGDDYDEEFDEQDLEDDL
jgi:hypothetical protein